MDMFHVFEIGENFLSILHEILYVYCIDNVE